MFLPLFLTDILANSTKRLVTQIETVLFGLYFAK